MKILVIDDDQENCIFLEEFLGKSKGHMVISAYDGKTGLELMQKEKFDVILLDLAMPKFSGYDVLDELKQKDQIKDNKIIANTAASLTSEDESTLLEMGVFAINKKTNAISQIYDLVMSSQKH